MTYDVAIDSINKIILEAKTQIKDELEYRGWKPSASMQVIAVRGPQYGEAYEIVIDRDWNHILYKEFDGLRGTAKMDQFLHIDAAPFNIVMNLWYAVLHAPFNFDED